MPASNLSTADWWKSSRSTDEANCVEVALTGSVVAVRDSKCPAGGALLVPGPPGSSSPPSSVTMNWADQYPVFWNR